MRTDLRLPRSRNPGWPAWVANLSGLAALITPLIAPIERGPITWFVQASFAAAFLGGASLWAWQEARSASSGSRAVALVGALVAAGALVPTLLLPSGGYANLLLLFAGASLSLSHLTGRTCLRPLVAAASAVVALRLHDALTLFTAPLSEWLRFLGATLFEANAPLLGWTGRCVEASVAALALSVAATWDRIGLIRYATVGLTGLAIVISTALDVDADHEEPLRFLLLFVPMALALIPSEAAKPRTRVSLRVTLASSAVAACLGAGAFHLPMDAGRRPSAVAILEGAYATEIPDVNAPKVPTKASMGAFFRWLDGSVAKTTYLRTLDANTLAEHDTLVMVNLCRELTADELHAIDTWVHAGGRLLFLGDHTDIFGVMRFSNPLIERFGIRLAFDSAIPLKSNWRHVLALRWSRTAAATPSPDLIRISVGASLELEPGSRPLVVARAGYGDVGDAAAPQKAFLGNWSYDTATERSGDLVLIAEASVGDGRVVVCGDTAFFQETSFSQSWPFVDGLLRDLAHPPASRALAWCLGAAIVLSLAVFAFTAGTGFGTTTLVALLAGVLLSTTAAQKAAAHAPLRSRSIAWIHTGRGSNLDAVTQNVNEVSGFANALLASGFDPLLTTSEHLPALAENDVVVKPAGAAAMDAAEERRLLEFCQRGGRVIAFVGPEDRERTPLLARHGLSVLDEPAGTCPGAEAVAGLALPTFRQAWPLSTVGSAVPHRVLVKAFARPVVVQVPIGSGSWTWISDPQFLWDKNFKISAKGYQQKNFQFVQGLLERKG